MMLILFCWQDHENQVGRTQMYIVYMSLSFNSLFRTKPSLTVGENTMFTVPFKAMNQSLTTWKV